MREMKDVILITMCISNRCFLLWHQKWFSLLREENEKMGTRKKGENILRESFELLLARLNEQHRENEK